MSSRVPVYSTYKFEITVPFGETVGIDGLLAYVKAANPRAVVEIDESSYEYCSDLNSDLSSELSSYDGDETTNSERNYQRRARGHLEEEASVASLTSIVDELDQSHESEPDGETLGTEDSTRSSDSSAGDDLSFISQTENDLSNVDLEWKAQNDLQDLKLLGGSERTVPNEPRSPLNFEVFDLTEDEQPRKRVRFS